MLGGGSGLAFDLLRVPAWLTPVQGGPPELSAEPESPVFGQDAEVRGQQHGQPPAVGACLHRADGPGDLPASLHGKHRPRGLLQETGVEEREPMVGHLLGEGAE